MIACRPRALTIDERRAAEAAFRGQPLDPDWPTNALAVYFGIMARTHGRNVVETEDCYAASSR